MAARPVLKKMLVVGNYQTPPKSLVQLFGAAFDTWANAVDVSRADFQPPTWDWERSLKVIPAGNSHRIKPEEMVAMAIAEWGPSCFDGMTYTTSEFLGAYRILLIRSEVVDQISADDHDGYDEAFFKPYARVSVDIGQRHLPGAWGSGGPNDDLRKEIDQILSKHRGNLDGLAFSDRVGCKFNVRSGRDLNHLMKDFEAMFRSFGYAERVPLWKKCPHGRYWSPLERSMCSDCSQNAVQADRAANKRCTMCGDPLSIAERLLKRTQHKGCVSFVKTK